MTISMTDTAMDMEKKAIQRCAQRNRFRFWIAWIYCGIFLISSAVLYIFAFTDLYNNYILSNLALRNGTRSFEWWEHSPVKLKYKIYVFNYTNVNEFEAGLASKLRVEEVGPYIYHETTNRMNAKLDDNGTISFQVKRSYEWIGGRPSEDPIVVPNVPLMFATAYVRDLGFAVRFFMNTVLSSLREKTFVNVTTDGFLWGYDTKLFQMAKPLMMLERSIPYDKFGLMAAKNGVDEDRIKMDTGSRGLENLGEVEQVNGMDNWNVWDDERCDKIGGSEGNMFPPNLLKDTSKPLYVYSRENCRKLPFRFAEQTTTYGIPSLKYTLTPNIYNYSDKQNECFCPKIHGKRVCPPMGLFNMSACNYGSPILSSFPHFYGGDKSLLEQIDGLNPRREDHEPFLAIHSRLASGLAGWSRLQVNLEVRKANGVFFLEKLKDRMILPLMWVEVGIDEIPDYVIEIFKQAYFTVINVEMAFQWGSLIIMILSLSAMIACLWKYRADMILRRNSSHQNNFQELL